MGFLNHQQYGHFGISTRWNFQEISSYKILFWSCLILFGHGAAWATTWKFLSNSMGGHGEFMVNMWISFIVGGWCQSVRHYAVYYTYLENIVYHSFRQLWLFLGVELMEIDSNLFSRYIYIYMYYTTIIPDLFLQKKTAVIGVMCFLGGWMTQQKPISEPS